MTSTRTGFAFQLLGIDEMIVVLPASHSLAGSGRVRIDALAADLPGKIALVATGHAIARVPGVLATTLRADVTTLALVNPPTRGIYAILPRHDPHPSAPLLVAQLTMAFR